MRRHALPRHSNAFTLIEMLIAVAVVALIVTLAAPSFRDMILMQRLRGTNAQLVSDLNFARSEAVSRAQYVQVRFQRTVGAGAMSCYIVHTRTDLEFDALCDCTAAAGARCPNPALATEIRTMQFLSTEDVVVAVPAGRETYLVDPRTGALAFKSLDYAEPFPDPLVVDGFIDSSRLFRNSVGSSGRVSVCAPPGSTVGGTLC